jgi:hypothetical protein
MSNVCILPLQKKYELWLSKLTINGPLILKMRDIIFLQAKYIMEHFKGYFEEAETFVTPKLS